MWVPKLTEPKRVLVDKGTPTTTFQQKEATKYVWQPKKQEAQEEKNKDMGSDTNNTGNVVIKMIWKKKKTLMNSATKEENKERQQTTDEEKAPITRDHLEQSTKDVQEKRTIKENKAEPRFSQLFLGTNPPTDG